MHRFVWDLHYPAPGAVRHEYPISAIYGDTPRYPLGPAVLPGEYTVKLTAGGQTVTAPLTIKMDPRVKTPEAGLRRQFELAMQVTDAMNRSYAALQRDKNNQQLARINGELGELLEILEGADETPTAQAAEAAAELRRELDALLGK